jgi:hypothetical protein
MREEAEGLAKELRRMYESGREERLLTTMIHLFGIKYDDEIEACGATPQDLCRMAGLKKSYNREISKGRRLAPFVEIKLLGANRRPRTSLTCGG